MPAADKPVTNFDDLEPRAANVSTTASTSHTDEPSPPVTSKKTKGKKKLKNKPTNTTWPGPVEITEDTPATLHALPAVSPQDDVFAPVTSPIATNVILPEAWVSPSTPPPCDSHSPVTASEHALLDFGDGNPGEVAHEFNLRMEAQPINAGQAVISNHSSWKEPEHVVPKSPQVTVKQWAGTSASPQSGDDLGFRSSPMVETASRRLSVHAPTLKSTQSNGVLSHGHGIDVKVKPPRPQSFPRSTPPYPQRHDTRTQAQPFPSSFDPPLPHRMQSHFFALPDIGLGLGSKPEQGKLAGSCGYCCTFDSFTESGEPSSAKYAKDVLLVGSEGGLDVYRVASDKFEVMGRLEGLRGAVIGARVIPQPHDSALATPLLALVIYGPVDATGTAAASFAESNGVAPRLFQTTVEVYSLASQNHVATLYRGLMAPFQAQTLDSASHHSTDPERFSIDVSASFVTLASGKSGEIWIFSSTSPRGVMPTFPCLGKLWTSTQSPHETPRPQHAVDKNMGSAESYMGTALYSLSSRWLAVIPPYTSAGITIQGSPVLQEENAQIPGLSTQLAPVQPLVTCEIAGIGAEGTFGWLSRKAAQGLVKASQRGYEMGLQGWKELTNPSQPASHASTNHGADIFPPTNGPANDPRRLAKEPALVSIYDLEMLVSAREQRYAQVPPPLATFALVDGCNHLSFSPDGMKLLTTDRTGEVTTVWDLQHIAHGKTRFDALRDSEFERGPHVRQVHRLVRSTPSTVIGSVWSRDGDKLALLTTHGTIHMHDIPLTSPIRKRHRKTKETHAETSEKADATVSISQGVSPPSSNSFWNTFRTGVQSVGAQVNTIRSRSTGLPMTFAGFREVTAAAGQASSRAVAKGLTHGYAAAKGGASDIWHSEDNKIRQKGLQDVTNGKCFMRWIDRRGETFLAVSGAGKVHVYPVQQENRRKGNLNVMGLRKFPSNNFTLPRITTREETNACARQGPHGFWILQSAGKHGLESINERALGSQTTELESNPPYCPFHIDSRVSIFAFEDGPNASQVYDGLGLPWSLKGHGIAEETPWTFGECLPPSTRMNDHSGSDVDDAIALLSDQANDFDDQVESKITVQSTHKGGTFDEHIRLNTRRARNLNTKMSDEHLSYAGEDNEF